MPTTALRESEVRTEAMKLLRKKLRESRINVLPSAEEDWLTKLLAGLGFQQPTGKKRWNKFQRLLDQVKRGANGPFPVEKVSQAPPPYQDPVEQSRPATTSGDLLVFRDLKPARDTMNDCPHCGGWAARTHKFVLTADAGAGRKKVYTCGEPHCKEKYRPFRS